MFTQVMSVTARKGCADLHENTPRPLPVYTGHPEKLFLAEHAGLARKDKLTKKRSFLPAALENASPVSPSDGLN